MRKLHVIALINLLLLAAVSVESKEKGMEAAKKEAQEFGKKQKKKALNEAEGFSTDFLKPADSTEAFDPEHAQELVLSSNLPSNEISEFLQSEEVKRNAEENRSLDEDEFFIQRSEFVTQNPLTQIEMQPDQSVDPYELKKCEVTNDRHTITFTRNLEVAVEHKPEERRKVKVCKGHSKKETHFWKRSAEKEKDKLKKKLSKSSIIKSFHSKISGGGWFSKYTLETKWKHVDDCSKCNHYKREEKVVRKESWKESGDRWVSDQHEQSMMSKSPDCTLLTQTCLDDAKVKVINKKKVSRKCWKEELSFICRGTSKNKCAFLKTLNCQLVDEHCAEKDKAGCYRWVKTFKCFNPNASALRPIGGTESIYGLNDNEQSYKPNESFAEVATKLSVFGEMKRELEATQAIDARKVELFRGKDHKCTKNVLDKVLYDCCFSMDGMAARANLAKCSSEEIALGERRSKGLCHYVGAYDEKLLNALWKSRDVHVFCCFTSKLSRVLHEQARKQLGISWGSPENPKCGGLTHEELTRLDFSKIDLSEVFEDQLGKIPDNIEGKMQSFQRRLEDIQASMKEKQSRAGSGGGL